MAVSIINTMATMFSVQGLVFKVEMANLYHETACFLFFLNVMQLKFKFMFYKRWLSANLISRLET